MESAPVYMSICQTVSTCDPSVVADDVMYM